MYIVHLVLKKKIIVRSRKLILLASFFLHNIRKDNMQKKIWALIEFNHISGTLFGENKIIKERIILL